MQLKSISAFHGGKLIQLDLPDKKSIVLEGSSKDYLLSLIKALLGVDYGGYMSDSWEDKDILTNNAYMKFTNGSVYCKEGYVMLDGNVPLTHCVYARKEGGIDSFLLTQGTGSKPLDFDMTKYTDGISQQDWLRLKELINRFAGFEFMQIRNKELYFNEVNAELETAYLLMAESFLTPENYLRVVLIPELECFTPDRMFEFVELLDNIHRLEVVLVSADVNIDKDSVVTAVNC